MIAKRSTRNKIRWHAGRAYDELIEGIERLNEVVDYKTTEAYGKIVKAQSHLVQIGSLADHRSDYIDNNLPEIVAGLELIIEALGAFKEGL